MEYSRPREPSREKNYRVFLFLLLIIRNSVLLFSRGAYVPPGILRLFGNSTYSSYSRESSRPSPFHRISRFNSTEIQLLRLPGKPDFRKHFHRNLSPPIVIVQISRLRRLISSPWSQPYTFSLRFFPLLFPFVNDDFVIQRTGTDDEFQKFAKDKNNRDDAAVAKVSISTRSRVENTNNVFKIFAKYSKNVVDSTKWRVATKTDYEAGEFAILLSRK